MSKAVLLTCILLATGVTAQTGNFFNCNRDGQSCGSDGVCDQVTGTCKCNVGFGLVKSFCVQLTDENCTNACSGQGICRQTGGAEKCYCDPTYQGLNCETPRITVNCSSLTMNIIVTPFGNFTGAIYAVGRRTEPGCLLSLTSPGTFSLILNLNNTVSPNCGLTGPTDLVNGTDNPIGHSYDLTVNIQYTVSPNILLASDQTIHAQCQFLNNNPIFGNLSSVNATSSNLDQGQAIGSYAPLVFRIMKGADDNLVPATSSITVKDNLSIMIQMLSNSVFDKFRVESCRASNRPSDNGDGAYDSFSFVESACPSKNAVVRGSHIKMSPDPAAGPEVQIPIKSFMFLKGAVNNTNQLHISCSVHLCAAADTTNCATPNCTTNPDFPDGLGRRRRDADGVMDGMQTRTLEQTVTVRAGNLDSTESFSNTNTEGSLAICVQNPEMQTVIAVMGLAILALLLGLIVVLFLYCHRRRRSKKDGGIQSGMSSTSDLDMHIPRPRT